MISHIVENELIKDKQTRNNDRLLILNVWENYGFHLTFDQRQLFMDLPSAETIRRIRQKFQEQGKYPADEQIRRERKFKGLSVRQRIHGTRPDKIDNLINERLI